MWGGRWPWESILTWIDCQLLSDPDTKKRTAATLMEWMRSSRSGNRREIAACFRVMGTINILANLTHMGCYTDVYRMIIRLQVKNTIQEILAAMNPVLDEVLAEMSA